MTKSKNPLICTEEKKERTKKLYRAPIKQFVREEGWIKAAKKRKVALKGKRELRYFSLCSLLALDIKTLSNEGIIQRKPTGYESAFFCEWEDEFVEEIARVVGSNYYAGSFEDFIEDLYNNKDSYRDKLKEIKLFPFDIYNLDFTGSCIPTNQPPYSKTLDSLVKLVGLQHQEKQDFDLFLTFRAKRREDNKQAISMLKSLLDNNCRNNSKAKEKLEALYKSTSNLLQEYTEFITIAIPKFLLNIAKDFSYTVDINPSYKYKRRSPTGPPYYITNLILTFKYRGKKGSDGPAVLDIIKRKYYPVNIEQLFTHEIIDVDRVFSKNKGFNKLYQKKVKEIEVL